MLSLRVVTWNIKFGIEIDTAIQDLTRIRSIAAPDILLLQEMDEEGTRAIAESLDSNHVYFHRSPHSQTGRDFGNAIISPWPITQAFQLDLPHQARISGHPRSATRGVVMVEDEPILTYSVHAEIPALPLARRVEQFRCLAADRWSQQSKGIRGSQLVVVGGDFNSVTGRGVAALKKEMESAELAHVSVEAGPSFRRAGINIPLDHIFASGLHPIRSSVAWSATASDHMPMWVELRDEVAAK